MRVLPYGERALLFAQLATLEQAGLPVSKALATLRMQAETQRRIEAMSRLLAQGRDLATAGQQAGVFSGLEATLIRAAQSSGSPAFVYQRLGASYELRVRQAKLLRSRLLMPGLVMLLALLIQPLPALIGGGLSAAGYLWGVLQPFLILAAIGAVFMHLLRRVERPATSSRSDWLDSLLLATPVLGTVYARRNARDVFEGLGFMLEAGLPMFEALPKVTAMLSSARMRGEFMGLQQRVIGGASLADALRAVSFPGREQLVGLVRTGEASGTLPAALLGFAARETQALIDFQQGLATWLPRILYGVLVCWMAVGLMPAGGLVSPMPVGL